MHLFWVYICIWGKTWFLAFWAWLSSLKMMFSSSIHLLPYDKFSFFVAE
jgi:hypothetical protein